MDIKTVYGFVLIGIGFSFKIVAKHFGINGVIEDSTNGLIATGLFLIAGKELYNKSKEGT